MTKEEFTGKHSSIDANTTVTVSLLLDYTDEVLLPAIDRMMDQKFKVNNARLENNLKTYTDRKHQETIETLLKRIDKRFEEEKKFRNKIIEMFKKQRFGTAEDIAYLEGLVSS